MLLKEVVEKFTCGAFPGEHQNGIVQQLPEGELLMLQVKIAAVCKKDVLEFQDLFYMAGVLQTGIGIVGKNKIHLSVFKKIHAADGGLVGDFDVDIGKCLVEPAQIGYQYIAADRIAGPDAQLPSVQGMGFQNLVFPSLDEVDCGLDMAQEDLSLRGKLDALGASDKEILVQLLFQYLDGLAHGRLGDKELLGSLGKAERGGYVVKYFI